MDEIQALILGLVQGLTEYLPVSSSGHLEIGKEILGLSIPDEDDNLAFDVILHVATVLSTLVILWKEIVWLFKGLFKFKYNDETRYFVNILISMIPVFIVGVLLKDKIEALYADCALIVTGVSLLVTAALLSMTHFYKPQEREKIRPIDAFIIGIAQAVAVLPGLSRSGSTIATGLLLGNSKKTLAQFSFLMVIPPILGMALLSVVKIVKAMVASGGTEMGIGLEPLPLLIGFAAAFISGCFACKWMISLVKKCKLIYFGIYCAVVGLGILIFCLFR